MSSAHVNRKAYHEVWLSMGGMSGWRVVNGRTAMNPYILLLNRNKVVMGAEHTYSVRVEDGNLFSDEI